MRYEQIWNWCSDHKPKVICEIGTWNGLNAARMMKLSGAEKYIGFDMWEEGTEELDKIENNVKKHATKEDVAKTLEKYEIELIQGNTRETLPEYAKGKDPFIDMVFLDGGHSYATIKSDFLNILPLVKDTGTIFMDDYYFGCPDLRMGAQSMMGETNVPYTVLPKVDKAKGGYLIKLVRINMLDVPRVPKTEMAPEGSWSFEA